jgi:hypothetical protein
MNGLYMQEQDLDKFIVFVESMRTGDNDLEVDVIMEGFFNIYGDKSKYPFNDRNMARKVASEDPKQLPKVWPKLYAADPELLLTAIQHPDIEKATAAFQFIGSNMKGNDITAKAIQKALKEEKLSYLFKTFRSRAKKEESPNRMSRSADKAIEKSWAAGDEKTADRLLTKHGL